VGRHVHQPGAAPGDLDPRIGRAIGISLGAFLLFSFGWMFLAGIVILPALHNGHFGGYKIEEINLVWIDQGVMALSPIAAPIATIQAMDTPYPGRWQFWVIMSCWCLLAWAAAGAMYWLALRSFDGRLGRMHETSQETVTAEPPSLVPVGAAVTG
jgi:hypothetical protein